MYQYKVGALGKITFHFRFWFCFALLRVLPRILRVSICCQVEIRLNILCVSYIIIRVQCVGVWPYFPPLLIWMMGMSSSMHNKLYLSFSSILWARVSVWTKYVVEKSPFVKWLMGDVCLEVGESAESCVSHVKIIVNQRAWLYFCFQVLYIELTRSFKYFMACSSHHNPHHR